MAIQAGVGKSSQKDAYEAGFEACKQALEKSGEDKADLLVVFSSVSLDPEQIIRGVREAGNNAPIIGCTDAGNITNQGPSKNSVGVMAISSDQLKFYTGLGENIKGGAREAGQAVAKEIKEQAGDSLKAF